MTPSEVGRTGWKLAAPRGGVNAKGDSPEEPPPHADGGARNRTYYGMTLGTVKPTACAPMLNWPPIAPGVITSLLDAHTTA